MNICIFHYRELFCAENLKSVLKTILILAHLILPPWDLSHRPVSFDYTIVFGGCFQNDKVQVQINKVAVLKNYILNNQDTATKGRLSFTQSDKQITIFYNDQVKTRRAIRKASTLLIELTVNNEVKEFKVDLHNGKILVFDFCPIGSNARKLTLEQFQEPHILM